MSDSSGSARAVHDAKHRDLYERASALTPVQVPPHVANPGSDPQWIARAESNGVATEPLGMPADYSGTSPVEDVAISPHIIWTESDEVAALERMIAIYGIEPGQWYEIEWPPAAHLYDPGHVYETEWEPCDKHIDEEAPEGCGDCDESVREVVESAAEWRITANVRCFERIFDESGTEDERVVFSENSVEIRTLTQDPRTIRLGEPGRGLRW